MREADLGMDGQALERSVHTQESGDLQASRQLGLSVIGHGIGGTNFPDIMARLAKMQDRWVSDDRPVCHHPISRPVKVMAKRSTYVDVTYYREFLT